MKDPEEVAGRQKDYEEKFKVTWLKPGDSTILLYRHAEDAQNASRSKRCPT
jgi:hypothetical protein